jgi:hypothetical protein
MARYIVSEPNQRPHVVRAKYESAAATNYVAAVMPGKLGIIREVTVRQETKRSVGVALMYKVVDHGNVCVAYPGDKYDFEVLQEAQRASEEATQRLYGIAQKLGIEDYEKMDHRTLVRAVSERMPQDGSDITVKP